MATEANPGVCELCDATVNERCNDGVCRACHETESLEDCLADKQLRAIVGDRRMDEIRGIVPPLVEPGTVVDSFEVVPIASFPWLPPKSK